MLMGDNMKSNKWKQIITWVIFSELVGILSWLLSRQNMQYFDSSVVQSGLTPPAALFPVVWSILYGLMGYGAARIARTDPAEARSKALNIYITQLIVNFFWSPIFFNGKAYGFALLWLILLWFLVLRMITNFQKIDPPAAYLQLPYLLWLTFAAYLNFIVWYNNR